MRILLQFIVPVAVFTLIAPLMGVPWIAVVGLASGLGIALGWRIERRRIEERTRKTIMASVMDSQNTLLNNMVYFRHRAETAGTLDPNDLGAMDCAIRDAQARLIDIAETDLHQTRDLGGIRVLALPRQKLAS